MKPHDILLKYDEFFTAVKSNDVFDSRTTSLLHLAASMAVGCYP